MDFFTVWDYPQVCDIQNCCKQRFYLFQKFLSPTRIHKKRNDFLKDVNTDTASNFLSWPQLTENMSRLLRIRGFPL